MLEVRQRDKKPDRNEGKSQKELKGANKTKHDFLC